MRLYSKLDLCEQKALLSVQRGGIIVCPQGWIFGVAEGAKTFLPAHGRYDSSHSIFFPQKLIFL